MVLYPEATILFFILFPVGYVFFLRYLQGRRELKRMTGKLRDQSVYDIFFVKWFFSALTFSIFIVFTVLSLLGFPAEKAVPAEIPENSDIIFALDISYSMLAEDVSPSRIDRSVGIIKSILDSVPGQRYGLVVFKGTGAVMVPLTEDAGAVKNVLGYVTPSMLTSTGTNLEAGIRSAAGAFPSGEKRKRMILLFSDGETQAGDAQSAAMDTRRENIRTFVFAAGTPDGGRIPLTGGGYVMDEQGNERISRMNKTVLDHIAAAGNGVYFNASDPGLIPQAANEILDGAAFSDFGVETRERYRIFLAGALLFLLIHICIKTFPWRGTL